ISDYMFDDFSHKYRFELMQLSKSYISLEGTDTGGDPQKGSTDPPAFDEDYQAILDYALSQSYSIPTLAQQVKQNQFVLDLKAAGIWTQLDLLYVFATDGDRDFAKINWIDPGSFTATEHNTPSFTVNEGFTGNGSNAYLDTGWDSSNNGDNFQEEECSWFFYCNNNISNNSQNPFGLHEDTTAGANRIIFNTGGLNIDVSQINSAGFQTSFDGTNGFFHCRRVSDNDVRLFKNGTQAGFSNAIGTNGLSPLDWYVLAK